MCVNFSEISYFEINVCSKSSVSVLLTLGCAAVINYKQAGPFSYICVGQVYALLRLRSLLPNT